MIRRIKTLEALQATPGVTFIRDGSAWRNNGDLTSHITEDLFGLEVDVETFLPRSKSEYSFVTHSPKTWYLAEWMFEKKEDAFDKLYERMI